MSSKCLNSVLKMLLIPLRCVPVDYISLPDAHQVTVCGSGLFSPQSGRFTAATATHVLLGDDGFRRRRSISGRSSLCTPVPRPLSVFTGTQRGDGRVSPLSIFLVPPNRRPHQESTDGRMSGGASAKRKGMPSCK